MQMSGSQKTIWNRTEMHSGIRGATELLQQEVGQAGRVTLPNKVTLNQPINVVGGAAPAARLACDAGSPGIGAEVVQVVTDPPTPAPLTTAVSGMWAVTGPPNSY